MSVQLAATLFVVLLHDLMVHGDMIPAGTVLEVDRGVRNDWFGSKLCRDATEAEVAGYREEYAAATDELDAEVQELASRRSTLAGEIETLEGRKVQLDDEIEDLQKAKAALEGEVATLEKAKKAAAK